MDILTAKERVTDILMNNFMPKSLTEDKDNPSALIVRRGIGSITEEIFLLLSDFYAGMLNRNGYGDELFGHLEKFTLEKTSSETHQIWHRECDSVMRVTSTDGIVEVGKAVRLISEHFCHDGNWRKRR